MIKKWLKKWIGIDGRELTAEECECFRYIQTLDVKDGDLVVLRHPLKMSYSCIENLRGIIEDVMKARGFDIKVLVLEEGMTVDCVLSKPKDPASLNATRTQNGYQPLDGGGYFAPPNEE